MFDGLKKWGNTESDTGLFEMGDFPFLTADLYIWEKAERATQSKMGHGCYGIVGTEDQPLTFWTLMILPTLRSSRCGLIASSAPAPPGDAPAPPGSVKEKMSPSVH